MAMLMINEWLQANKRPLVIAGPCSVETEEQVQQTAKQLAKQNVQVLRGGIWKPRTRPGSFTGVGKDALRWLADAAQANGLYSSVEVATAEHVEQSLAAGIDILWIGARSTVSPFVVQELADALQGVNIPVLIKNPINPDLELWIGAIERLQKAGIQSMAAIHRGFSSFDKKQYRNVPNWDIPLELKRRMPDMPLICDPSHICGNKTLIAHVAQRAMDLNFEGLMIEAHYHPAVALSDKEQQLSPQELGELLAALVIRTVDSDNAVFLNQLQLLREKIDKLDYDILELLAERNRLVTDIGNYKKENNVSIYQPERWADILKTRTHYGKEITLSEELILAVLNAIHQESISIQTKVMNSNLTI